MRPETMNATIVPELFREIIRNDAERAELRAPKVIPFRSARDYAALQRERQDYRVAAAEFVRPKQNGRA